MKKTILILTVLSLSCLLFAEDALDIIRDMEKRSDNGPSKMTMSMEVYSDESSTTDRRSFELVSIKKDDNESYMEFLKPRSVKGLKILSSGRDNWVYFPSTGRVRKIAGTSRRGSVQGIGGDFSYEDLNFGDWEEKYNFSIRSTSDTEWILEGKAKQNDETYEKVVITVLRDIVRPVRIEFHTPGDGLLKILEISGYKSFSGKLEAEHMVMRNVKKKSKTEVTVLTASYSISPNARYFEPNRFYK